MRLTATGGARLPFTLAAAACLLLCLLPLAASSPGQGSAPQTQSPPRDCTRPYFRIESTKWVGRTVHHTLSAGLTGGALPKRELTYKWEVEPGKITSGQGTHSITVEMPECKCDIYVATEVEGLEAGCEKSVRWGINDLCFYPVSAESYGDITQDEEKALLGKHAPLLKKGQCWQMRITAHGKKGERTNEALARAERAKEYVVTAHGVEADRVAVVSGEPQDERKIGLFIFHGRFTP